MLRMFCKSKIHGARITFADLHYEGSITIDEELMLAAGLLPYERVQVVNINNGQRFETYVIKGKAGSGDIQLNGPAARLGEIGDTVHILAYALIDEGESTFFEPKIIHVDEKNRVRS